MYHLDANDLVGECIVKPELILIIIQLIVFFFCLNSTNWYTVFVLTLKAPVTTAADEIFFYFFFIFSEKTSLDISCELSAKQTIHMKCQDLFSLKNKRKNFECRLLKFCLAL